MTKMRDLHWKRIVAGGVVTHVISMGVLVAVIVGYSLVGTAGSGGKPDQLAIQQFSMVSGALLFPALTILITGVSAAWVAREVKSRTATSHGAGVGIVVGTLGLAFGALDLTMLVRFVTTVVAGVLGAKVHLALSVE
ncbi:hypothetical protein [Haloarchaeobius amylolyticus]|uniref:hypothetical protein n=1 Tax=Haloarchaeobius amylolyticus TaxID=1198296 RepID=UPI002270241F|nr:hypothetical protein [Haloarchaeobius amylolyticus]